MVTNEKEERVNTAKLVAPSVKYKKSYLQALQETREEDGETQLHKPLTGQSFEDFVKSLKDISNGLNLPEGYVPATTLWLLDDNEVIGRVQIRHSLNEQLKKNGGHIGYYIRPSKRNMGYGNRILQLGLIEAKKLGIKKALLTCEEKNLVSRKIIESNGGVLEDTLEHDNRKMRRYWIDISTD